MITLRFLVLLCLLGWAELGSASHEIPITADQMERLGISVVRIEPAAWVESDLMPARVVIPPRQERVVSAPSGGLVSGLQAGVGDEVEKGDTLALLESPALITLQREFLQTATEVKLASATLKRDQRLYKEGIIAERRYLETRGNFEQAKAALDEHRQALGLAGMIDKAITELERARRLSSSLSVQTPTAGVILDGMAVVGQRVERSDPLFRLAQLKPLWLEIRVPLDRLSGVRTGAAVALPCESSDARVILIGRNVDPDSQTVMVRAEVHEGSDCLRPGQFLQVRLRVSGGEQRYRVPQNAVARSREATLVFVHAPFGFFATEVKMVGQDNGHAIITGELRGDESVALSGLAAIKAAWMGLGGGE